jgi:DNA repair protein RecN (Recombination protein N)
MLTFLRIENFALIDHLQLNFEAGLNILTGETGAGKSIILDALDVVLGGKVNSRMIRTGNDKAVIETTFKINEQVIQWLTEQEIDTLEEGVIICCRELVLYQGTLRSRSRVNGVLVNRHIIESLRDRLIEITAQGQTVQLIVPALQRDLLDLFAGDILFKQRGIVSEVFTRCQEALNSLEKRRKSEQTRLQRIDLLSYQARELGEANLQDTEEWELLEQEQQRLNHVVDLQKLSYQVYQALYQNDQGELAASDLLAQAESLLSHIVEYDPELQAILDLVNTALSQVYEAGREINRYGDNLEADPERLNEVEERIRELKQICRKYGPTLKDAIAYYQQIATELAELTDGGQSLEELEEIYNQQHQKLITECAKLTEIRKNAAYKLESILIDELKPLAMEKVQFQVKIFPIQPNSMGADHVAFYFSPNPGEPLQPLASIASGGEMSRFLLALKSCFSQTEAASTLIFDEIDVGVSGRVAQAIADKLHQLSRQNQVLCVTHQPLVAAMADRHFSVHKHIIESGNNHNNIEDINDVRTVVRVKILDNHDHRQQELAQLAGGKSAQEAMTFAQSLLTQAQSKKQMLNTDSSEG